MERIAVFPGSFDPFTKGHARIVERTLKFFDKVIVAVGINESKVTDFMLEGRLKKIASMYSDNPRIEVKAYTTLTVDFVKQVGAQCIVRGIRSVKDFEYERDMADWNMRLAGIETLCLFAEPEYASISSSVLRELQSYGKDISDYLP